VKVEGRLSVSWSDFVSSSRLQVTWLPDDSYVSVWIWVRGPDNPVNWRDSTRPKVGAARVGFCNNSTFLYERDMATLKRRLQTADRQEVTAESL